MSHADHDRSKPYLAMGAFALAASLLLEGLSSAGLVDSSLARLGGYALATVLLALVARLWRLSMAAARGD